jgi:hypothetical protein
VVLTGLFGLIVKLCADRKTLFTVEEDLAGAGRKIVNHKTFNLSA